MRLQLFLDLERLNVIFPCYLKKISNNLEKLVIAYFHCRQDSSIRMSCVRYIITSFIFSYEQKERITVYYFKSTHLIF